MKQTNKKKGNIDWLRTL